MGGYTGMGNFNTSEQTNTVLGSFKPTSTYAGVTMPNLERAVNKSFPATVEETYKMDSAKDDLIDMLGDAFYGSGTSNLPDGLANIVDDGSVAATYANLTRSSYDFLDADVGTSTGGIALNTLTTSIDACTYGTRRPDLIISTPPLWRAIEDLLFPSVSANYGVLDSRRTRVNRMGEVRKGQALTGNAGYDAIFVRGIPVVADPKCTSGYIYYINTDVTFWSGLAHPDYGMIDMGTSTIDGVGNPVPKNHGIAWTGFKKPINQDGRTGQLLLYGQMICEMPRFNAVDQGCTA